MWAARMLLYGNGGFLSFWTPSISDAKLEPDGVEQAWLHSGPVTGLANQQHDSTPARYRHWSIPEDLLEIRLVTSSETGEGGGEERVSGFEHEADGGREKAFRFRHLVPNGGLN